MRMLAGRWTVEFLSQLNFDVAFVSCAGVTLDEGLTTARRPLADVINAARATAPAHGRADRLDQVRARVAAHDHARGEPDLIITDDGARADVATTTGPPACASRSCPRRREP